MNTSTDGPSPPHVAKSAVAMHTITDDEAGQRIDNFLMRHFKNVPRSRVYRILRKGEVRVNRKRVDAEYKLSAGDEVRLPPVRVDTGGSEPGQPSTSLLELIERSVIFQDKHIIVLDKPAGVAVHGGSGMSFGVIEALRASRPREVLELVHRLDRDTSGCLLIARDRTTLVSLHALIRDGGIHKTYMALVAGSWQLGTKRIDAPLATDSREHGERHVRVAQAGKTSVSLFKPLQFFGSLATLMEVGIPTGRTHQIRVHASFAGHPLLGDDKIRGLRTQRRVQAIRFEAHLPARPAGGVRMAGIRGALSRKLAVAAGVVGRDRCHHADETQEAERPGARQGQGAAGAADRGAAQADEAAWRHACGWFGDAAPRAVTGCGAEAGGIAKCSHARWGRDRAQLTGFARRDRAQLAVSARGRLARRARSRRLGGSQCTAVP